MPRVVRLAEAAHTSEGAYLRLREGEEEKEDGPNFPVKGDPACDVLCRPRCRILSEVGHAPVENPASHVFEGDKGADDGPVHAPPLEVRL